MKQATLLTVFIAVMCSNYATPVHKEVSYKVDSDTTLVTHAGIHDMLQKIIGATGLQLNFELKEARVLNIEATTKHRKRYISYNPAFITSLTTASKDKWAVMALLAHEVGHHLNGHTIRRGGSSPELELEADEFAGFILYKLGATLSQSQNVMNYIAKTKGSKTHPSRGSRMNAIEKGWSNASEAMAATGKSSSSQGF